MENETILTAEFIAGQAEFISEDELLNLIIDFGEQQRQQGIFQWQESVR